LAAAFPLGHALGRVGCFFNGCCYGRLCSADTPFAITYPPEWMAGRQDLVHGGIAHGPRLSAPLIEAAGLVVIGALLVAVFRRTKSRGQVVALYCLLYPCLRFFQEFTRDDYYRGMAGGLSSGQWFSLGLFALGLGLLALYLRRRARGLSGEPYTLVRGGSPREADAFSKEK